MARVETESTSHNLFSQTGRDYSDSTRASGAMVLEPFIGLNTGYFNSKKLVRDEVYNPKHGFGGYGIGLTTCFLSKKFQIPTIFLKI